MYIDYPVDQKIFLSSSKIKILDFIFLFFFRQSNASSGNNKAKFLKNRASELWVKKLFFY